MVVLGGGVLSCERGISVVLAGCNERLEQITDSGVCGGWGMGVSTSDARVGEQREERGQHAAPSVTLSGTKGRAQAKHARISS